MKQRRCSVCGIVYVTSHDVCPRCALRLALAPIAGGEGSKVSRNDEEEAESRKL